MARGNGAKNAKLDFSTFSADDFDNIARRIIYIEIIKPRYSSDQDSFIHLFLLNERKLDEYEIRLCDDAETFDKISNFMSRFMVADMFRMYRVKIGRIYVRKGVALNANNDLGGFVWQSYKESFLISPKMRFVFDRLKNLLTNYEDGTAQLIRIGRLLENEKFLRFHNEFFGKIGIATLRDSKLTKHRYADSLMSSNVITNERLFREYLDCINTIPMSDFTSQSIVAQANDDRSNIKKILMENFSNFLFNDEDEIDFFCELAALFLYGDEINLTTDDWIKAIAQIRYTNHDTFIRIFEDEENFVRELGLYRARYVLDKIPTTKFVHFLYSFLDLNNLSRNVGTFYPRLNDLLGEDIREKFVNLDTINVSAKSLNETKTPCDFFKYPQLVNFSTAADKKIQEQILTGEYNRQFVTFYLCNYMQVADYKKYSAVLPCVVSIIRNLKVEDCTDFSLYWMACDLLNQCWKLLPGEDKVLQGEFEDFIYDVFWPKIGDAWPIIHRKDIEFVNEDESEAFKESLGWIMSLDGVKYYDAKLKKYLASYNPKKFDLEDSVDSKALELKFAKSKNHRVKHFMEMAGEVSKESYYKAIYCEGIDVVDLMGYIFAYPSIGITEKYAMENICLCTRDVEHASKLFTALLDGYDYLEAFYKHYKNSKVALFNAFAALCESTTLEIELPYLRKLAKKMQEGMLGAEYDENIEHMLAVAEAHSRQANFQTKDITVDFIKSLH